MAEFNRSTTLEQVAEMRKDLKEMAVLQGLLRSEVQRVMTSRGLNHASLARMVEIKSPRRIQEFFAGKYIVSSGKSLRSMAAFADFDDEFTNRIEQIALKHGSSACALPLYGERAVDFVCDLFVVFFRDSVELGSDDFATLFDGASDFVLDMLSKRFEGLTPFLDPETRQFTGPEGSDVTRHVQALLNDPEELRRRMRKLLEANEASYAALVQRWNEFQAEYGPTQREATERLRVPKSSVSMALSLRNPYRLNSLRAIIEKVDRFIGQSREEVVAEHATSDTPEPESGRHRDEESGSVSPIPIVGRLTRDQVRSLSIDEHRALVELAYDQSHRLLQTLGFLLRSDDDEVLAYARAKLGRVLAEVHDSVFLVTSHVRLEELIEIVEGEQSLRQRLRRS